LTGRSKSEPGSPEKSALREADCRIVGRAEPLITWRRPMSEPHVWNKAVANLPGVVEDGMSGRKGSESVEALEGRLGAVCTAKASGISRKAVKSGCAREWGGWGRLSVDGPGQKNPDRSEGPWGRAAKAVRTRCFSAPRPPTQNGNQARAAGNTKDAGKLNDARVASHGKALSDQPALKPYWGKPAVRNFREGHGNVGIMRSPLRAIALPDQSSYFLGRNHGISKRSNKGKPFCCLGQLCPTCPASNIASELASLWLAPGYDMSHRGLKLRVVQAIFCRGGSG
jgi:hypothetical protein